MARQKGLISKLMIHLFVFGVFFLRGGPLWGHPFEKPETTGDRSWARDAQELLESLERVVEDSTRASMTGVITNRMQAHAIIWRLWLVTGHPPELNESLKLEATSPRHVEHYRRFIAQHSNLTKAEVNHLGLLNGKRAYGSPLCFMTLEYVKKKTVHLASTNVSIHTTPRCRLVLQSTSDEQRHGLSAVYLKWLTEHLDSMKWDCSLQRFRQLDGSPIDIEEIAAAVGTVLISDRRPLLPVDGKK